MLKGIERGGRLAFGLLLTMVVTVAQADVEITAEYRNADNTDEFINTTPSSGFCAEWGCQKGMFSIAMPFTYERAVISGNGPLPERWSIRTPAARTVNVTSASGASANLTLQISHISQNIGERSQPYDARLNPSMVQGGGCTYLEGYASDGGVNFEGYLSQVNNPTSPTVCYSVAPGGIQSMPIIAYAADTSVGYKLILPKASSMPTGVYTGSTTFTVGENGDFALGPNLIGLDANSVTVNFTLTVHHELDVQFPANSDRVVLEPDTGNWQRWLNTGEVPTLLRATLPFRLTVSGPFSIGLYCEQGPQVGSCILRNKRTNKEALFFTNFKLDKFNKIYMYPGDPQDLKLGYLNNLPGSFNFELYAVHMGDMLTDPGDEWAATVTLVFDARI
jgi:hypothetical protein